MQKEREETARMKQKKLLEKMQKKLLEKQLLEKTLNCRMKTLNCRMRQNKIILEFVSLVQMEETAIAVIAKLWIQMCSKDCFVMSGCESARIISVNFRTNEIRKSLSKRSSQCRKIKELTDLDSLQWSVQVKSLQRLGRLELSKRMQDRGLEKRSKSKSKTVDQRKGLQKIIHSERKLRSIQKTFHSQQR